jgi:glutamate dehydrogenase (NADP+)
VRTCRPRPAGIRLFEEAPRRLRAGQGGQRRRRRDVGAGDAAERERDAWTFEHSEQRLHEIMTAIHRNCHETAIEFGSPGNYILGANIVGFRRVAEAMLAFGVI